MRNSKGVTRVVHYNLMFLHNFGIYKKPKILVSYYVMPLYQSSLSSLLNREDFSAQNISELAAQILESLQTVHSTGRTFNDLKTDNIMLDGS